MNGSGGLSGLEAVLDHAVPVAVQAHDFPDIDALGAAWGLASLLSCRGFVATPIYRGELRSRSLCNTVRELGLPVGEALMDSGDRFDIIAMDCAPENGNVSLVKGRLAAIVDHHVPASDPVAPFVDIRMDSGSCSSIVVDYWRESGFEPERRLATALLAGLQADTDFLARGAGPLDIEAFHWLAGRADRDLAAGLVKTALASGDLRRIESALASSLVTERAFFAFVPDALNQESLSILADFVLRVEDVEVALVAERDDEGIRLSIRSRDHAVPAFDLARSVLAGIGSGGGHQRSAGGRIPASKDPGDEALSSRFFAALARMRAN